MPSHRPHPVPPFELDEASIPDLQRGLDAGRYSSRALVERYLARVEQLDRQGPALRSILEINPDALDLADSLDDERRDRGPRGPLHGIPVLLKDNLGTADRMTTTAGSLALEGSIAPCDSFVAERLRAAGAVLLGKANMSEWANFRSTKSISGWSASGGQCRCPYRLDLNPSGSSSGSAVAVAANLAPVSVGTETDGSIIQPASVNGIVGIKPTVGLVSRSEIIPISHSQDTAGPMARTVADAALLLGALTGVDDRDPATATSQGRAFADYTRFLDPDGLRGARIGVARQFIEDDDRVMHDSIEALRSAGAVLIDLAEIKPPVDVAEWEILQYEFKAGLNQYLERLGPGAPVRSLEEIIEFNDRHSDLEMPLFGQDVLLESQAKEPLEGPEYLALLASYSAHRTVGIDRAVEGNGLDAVVAPIAGGAVSQAAVAGYPSITVPAGCVDGAPVGILFLGPAYSEPALIRIAYAYERITRARLPPEFLVTIE